jgi:hypothetical protein
VGEDGDLFEQHERSVLSALHTSRRAKEQGFNLNRIRGTYRWFASPNVVKLEDYRQSGEMGRIIILLRQRKRDEARAAAAKILAESRRRCKEQEVGV